MKTAAIKLVPSKISAITSQSASVGGTLGDGANKKGTTTIQESESEREKGRGRETTHLPQTPDELILVGLEPFPAQVAHRDVDVPCVDPPPPRVNR